MSPAEILATAPSGAPTTFIAKLREAPFPAQPWSGPAYADNRVLFHVPAAFRADRPYQMLVFYHGMFSAIVGKTIQMRFGGKVFTFDLPGAVDEGSAQTILVAPQLAKNAGVSGAGKLERAGGFTRLMAEAAEVLRRVRGDAARPYETAPILVNAYSGGHKAMYWSMGLGPDDAPVAQALKREPAAGRIRGLILFDTVFRSRYSQRIRDWVKAFPEQAFIYGLYSVRPDEVSELLIAELAAIRPDLVNEALDDPAPTLAPPMLRFRQCRKTAHEDIPNLGPPKRPLAALLGAMPIPDVSPTG
jgi:hypothetical protein